MMQIKTRRSVFASFVAAWIVLGTGLAPTLAQQTATPTPSSATPSAAAGQPATWKDRIDQLWQTHQIPIIVAGLAVGGYLGVLWLKPCWLLKVPSTDLALPWTKWKIPLTLVRPLKYRDRVLDAWVEQRWPTAQAEFLKLPTVDNRSIHIGLPVRLDKTPISDLTGQNLVPTFQKKPAVLLITGEGGAGKTSLACQIAQWGLAKQLSRHRMLPVLIENDLEGQTILQDAIRGQLSALTNQADPITPELLEKLLQRQRILVIVDHLSEMGEATRAATTPNLADFPAKALIVTSRLEEPLGGVPKTVLKPLQIEANRLWPFMLAYLEAQGKQAKFEDDEYASGCDRLRRMAGDRPITVLLARLYIDHMIQEREGAGGILPDSVPKLMLSYLNQLNRTIEPKNRQDDLAIQRDAKALAWECLKQTYRPKAIKIDTALATLTALDNNTSAKARLDYLEKRLQFLQTPEPGDRTRIILDPLAEYLAAAHLVEHHCQQADPESAWNGFFTTLDQILEKENETPEIMRGFLLALRDCCLDNAHEEGIPAELPDQLARKANIDPDELRRAEEKRRIRRLIFDLSAYDLQDRLDALAKLGRSGATATVAQPNLEGMLENPNQPLVARQAAAQTLGKLAIGDKALLALLGNSDEELAVRRSAAEALGQMKAGQDPLRQILENAEQPLVLRQGAARALALIGAASGEVVPMLQVAWQSGQVITQVSSIRVWREPLANDVTLDLVAIPGGTFPMGSPPEEVGRDVYPSAGFSETEGVDVEAQHEVTLSPFWLGQAPITQAQWRAVAALPRVNRDLGPDPANFKGDDRPVEYITWYEAVEFCDRLSQHTGKTYRLPSEAEWEYACRAGTTTPFHFGETLSTDWANYNGTYTYGDGVVGEYREKTTDVGSFGVNAFGLADMHGNVWEWCLDHWHPSYEGAPTDGSAWETEGDSRYRLLRGGSWCGDPTNCRSGFRVRNFPGVRNDVIGLRVVCVSPWT